MTTTTPELDESLREIMSTISRQSDSKSFFFPVEHANLLITPYGPKGLGQAAGIDPRSNKSPARDA